MYSCSLWTGWGILAVQARERLTNLFTTPEVEYHRIGVQEQYHTLVDPKSAAEHERIIFPRRQNVYVYHPCTGRYLSMRMIKITRADDLKS